MTDKVQKIRNKVERLKSQLIRGACSSQIAMETRCKEEAYNEVLAILDSLQEEPNITGIKSKHATDKLKECIDNVKKAKLNTMLDESLSKETKESWNERLGEEKPKFKVGDIIRKINDGLEAKVTSIDNSGFIYAACEDWEQIIYPKDWELVEMPISKVWHDASEEPKSDKDIAVVTREGFMWSRYKIEGLARGWKQFVSDAEIDKWAYVSDLINL